MATAIYTLYTPILAIGNGVGTLAVTDTNDNFFEVPDLVTGGQSATVNGNGVTINSVTAAVGPQVVVALVNGLTVNINLTPIRVVVNGIFPIPDTTYIVYPGLPPGAFVVSLSAPLVFGTGVGLPVCLTTNTLVLTDQGQARAGDIVPGDLVQTRDNGLQPVRWVGTQKIRFDGQPLNHKFRPIILEPDALEAGSPETRLTVSPQHAIVLRSPHAMLLFAESEVLVAAKHLVNGISIRIDADCIEITYCHILLDMHAIIIAEGADVESLYLGDVALRSVGSEAQSEIFAIFPELRDQPMRKMDRARLHLNEFEARVLVNAVWGRPLAGRALHEPLAMDRLPESDRRIARAG